MTERRRPAEPAAAPTAVPAPSATVVVARERGAFMPAGQSARHSGDAGHTGLPR